MGNGSVKMGCCLNRRQANISYHDNLGRSVVSIGSQTPVRFCLSKIWIAVFLFTVPAFSQYMVQPMQRQVEVRPGTLVQTTLDVYSLDPNTVNNISFKVVELSQYEDGSWQILDTDPNSIDFEEGYDISKLSSCRQWIHLSPSSVELAPMGQAVVNVDITIPRTNVSGFYFVGILASMPATTGGNIPIKVRFMVPYIIEIQGRALRSAVEMQDLGMQYMAARGERPSTTLISMRISNNGPTLSSLQPHTRVWSFQDDHWRLIKTQNFDDVKIIPGAKLNLKTDIMQSLPSGRYRVAGGLYVDNRRTKSIQKEFDFIGDPTVKRVAGEAPLDLKPRDIVINGLPGATRRELLRIHNASDETITIQGVFGTPPSLQAGAIPGSPGVDMVCSEWLKIEPEQFTLDSYAEKNVYIVAEIPDSAVEYPYYYGLLGLWATYPDGQRAGLTTANVCVGNQRIEAQPQIGVETITLNEYDPEKSQFLVLAEFSNGNVHLEPTWCGAAVATGIGMRLASVSLNTNNRGFILPFERRMYSGILDLSSVPAGAYRVEAIMRWGEGQEQSVNGQIAIQVSLRGNRREVSIIRTREELKGQLVEVQW